MRVSGVIAKIGLTSLTLLDCLCLVCYEKEQHSPFAYLWSFGLAELAVSRPERRTVEIKIIGQQPDLEIG